MALFLLTFTIQTSNLMKSVFLLLSGCILAIAAFAQKPRIPCSHYHPPAFGLRNEYDAPENGRSDTLDVIRYTIDLDMTQMGLNLISGACQVEFVSLINDLNTLHLDLQALTVDSVTSADGMLSFTHTGDDLLIELPEALMDGEAYAVTVHYGGDPATDTSWGGFYTTSTGFAYNIGVGFDADPHTIGRMWFPCVDNFVERSEYDLRVLTSSGRTAYCGGVRVSVDTVGTDSLVTRWLLADHPIPTYLASVAVSNYTHVDNEYVTALGETIPVWLTARPQDTTAMKNSFANLIDCLAGFELRYGPYRWPRVGFVSVPFNAGAMEHATNIAYPSFAINGNLTWETLMAHELSHHWWGDLVTCRTKEDMWLNEGWATYCEALFEELIYGAQAYDDYVADLHKEVLTGTPVSDGGYYPVSGVPHELTYSSTVYVKGSDIVHNLRGVMGDDNFFTACQTYLETHQFTDVSSADLRDHFQQYTTADLTAFFDHWVYNPGFPEIRTESQTITAGESGWIVDLTLRQYLHHAPEYYTHIPLEVTVMNAGFETETHTVLVTGEFTNVTLETEIEPVYIILNRDQTINYAVLADEQIINDTGNSNMPYAELDLNVQSLGSSTEFWIRAENHWAAANEPAYIPFTEYYIASDRWWNIQTDMPEDALVNATIRYWGDPNQNNYYDPLYFTEAAQFGNENDLIILYRPDGQSAWTEWPAFEVNDQGSETNWVGRIRIDGIRPGQYAWAIRTGVVGVEDREANTSTLTVAQHADRITIRSAEGLIRIHDAQGRLMHEYFSKGVLDVSTLPWSDGVYLISQGNQTVRCAVTKR
jgi:hypothetical protein